MIASSEGIDTQPFDDPHSLYRQHVAHILLIVSKPWLAMTQTVTLAGSARSEGEPGLFKIE